MTPCSVPSGLTTDRSASSNKVEVGSTDVMPNFLQVVVVKILIIAPKSTKSFENLCPLICTVTIGFPGSSYLIGASLLDNRSDKVPTTWTVGLFVILLLGFFIHSSLMVFAYIGISWIAWRSGIFIYKLFSSPRISKLGCSIGHGMINHSGNGGENAVAWS